MIVSYEALTLNDRNFQLDIVVVCSEGLNLENLHNKIVTLKGFLPSYFRQKNIRHVLKFELKEKYNLDLNIVIISRISASGYIFQFTPRSLYEVSYSDECRKIQFSTSNKWCRFFVL